MASPVALVCRRVRWIKVARTIGCKIAVCVGWSSFRTTCHVTFEPCILAQSPTRVGYVSTPRLAATTLLPTCGYTLPCHTAAPVVDFQARQSVCYVDTNAERVRTVPTGTTTQIASEIRVMTMRTAERTRTMLMTATTATRGATKAVTRRSNAASRVERLATPAQTKCAVPVGCHHALCIAAVRHGYRMRAAITPVLTAVFPMHSQHVNVLEVSHSSERGLAICTTTTTVSYLDGAPHVYVRVHNTRSHTQRIIILRSTEHCKRETSGECEHPPLHDSLLACDSHPESGPTSQDNNSLGRTCIVLAECT
jgi:hypothetical protein